MVVRDESEFWRRLVSVLHERGYGTKPIDVARLLDVYPSAVTHWRTGANLPKLARAIDIASLLEIDVNWLLTGQHEPTSPDGTAMDARSAELLKLWNEMDLSARKQALDYLRYCHAQAQAAKPPTVPPPTPRKR